MELKYFAWSKITFSRLTLVYFIFSLSYFVIQLAFQIKAYTINAAAHHVIDKIIHDAGTVNASLPLLRGSRLYLCSWIPSNLNTDAAACPVIWSADEGSTPNKPTVTTASPSSTFPPLMGTPNVFAPSETGTSNDPTDSVRDAASRLASLTSPTALPAAPNGVQATELSQQCLWALNWPNVSLRNTQREDCVFIAFQFWVLAVSIRALWNESIPHILASLLSHLMATVWGILQITHTAHFRAEFNRVITKGACKQTILNLSYWNARQWAELYALSLNGLALLISCALTWNLIKLFGWQTFKRIGASRTVNRAYKLFLSLSITIQLSFFFMAVTISLWIDQLMNSGIGDLSSFLTLYKATSFATLALLLPWSMTGWFGVRRELHLPTSIFLILSTLYLAGWGVMFFSTTFRWTFTTWFFFAVMASASVFLTFMGMVLGFVCRFNFGTGLARCLNANQPLCEEDGATTDVEEVAFPDSEKPFANLGKHDDDSTSDLGSKSPLNTTVHFVTFPQTALQRHSEDVETHRSHSRKSSISSNENSHSRKGSSGSNHSQRQRWVIE
jgi:hypothetical protein